MGASLPPIADSTIPPRSGSPQAHVIHTAPSQPPTQSVSIGRQQYSTQVRVRTPQQLEFNQMEHICQAFNGMQEEFRLLLRGIIPDEFVQVISMRFSMDREFLTISVIISYPDTIPSEEVRQNILATVQRLCTRIFNEKTQKIALAASQSPDNDIGELAQSVVHNQTLSQMKFLSDRIIYGDKGRGQPIV
jgi:hypothetical protein